MAHLIFWNETVRRILDLWLCLIQVLYTEGSEVHLMDDTTYEQIQVGDGEDISGLLPGDSVTGWVNLDLRQDG